MYTIVTQFREEESLLLEDELKIPVVSKDVVEYLDRVFNVDELMNLKTCNSDEHIGIIKGVREVIGRLRHLSQKED